MSANVCLFNVEILIKMQIMTAFYFLLPLREFEDHFEFNEDVVEKSSKLFCLWQFDNKCPIWLLCPKYQTICWGQNTAIKRKIGHEVSILITGRLLDVEKVVQEERCVIDNIVAHNNTIVYFVITGWTRDVMMIKHMEDGGTQAE